MSGERKHRRDVNQLLSEYSLTVLSERMGRHRVLLVRNKHGVEAHLTVAITPSDYRATQNLRAICREISERTS